MSSDSLTNALISDSEAEKTAPLTSAFVSSPIPMSPATDLYMQSQQFLPSSDLEASPLTPSGPIRRNRQVRQHQPYEPAPAGKAFKWSEEKEICEENSQKQISTPPTEPAVLPTIFYQQTTTVPLSSTTPPIASPVRMTRSVPVSPRQRIYHIRPSSSASLVRTETGRQRTRKRVNARKWSFLLPIIRYWRSQEGAPRARELGESSSTASRIIPVTGEPIHHTVPLLAARLVRHEDRIDAIATMINNYPPEHIEILAEDVEKLVMGQLALEDMIERMSAQFGEAMEFIGMLCTASTTTGTILETMDRELEIFGIQNETLRRALQESQARERARDQTMETMSTMIYELQRRMDDAPEKP